MVENARLELDLLSSDRVGGRGIAAICRVLGEGSSRFERFVIEKPGYGQVDV
jgi:hypothetical protein